MEYYFKKKEDIIKYIIVIDYPSKVRDSINKNNKFTAEQCFNRTLLSEPKMFSNNILKIKKIVKKNENLKIKFDDKNFITINTKNLNLNEDLWKFSNENKLINIPFGEVYFGYYPMLTLNGNFKSKHHGIFRITNGKIIDVEKSKYKKYVDGIVIELGFGVNDYASVDAHDSIAEKASNTIHIGIVTKNQKEELHKHIDIVSEYCSVYDNNKFL